MVVVVVVFVVVVGGGVVVVLVVVIVFVIVGYVVAVVGVFPIELSSDPRGHKQLCYASRATVPANGLAIMCSVVDYKKVL